jgi:hypothetical protein
MNMKRFAFLALVFMACGFLVYGQTAPRVYISGSYLDGVTAKACYWVDGERVDLPEGDYALGIVVENGIVYTAGSYGVWNSSNNRYVRMACYWVNGVRSVFDIRSNGRSNFDENINATGFAVTDGKVYVTGYEDQGSGSSRTVYSYVWIDGVRATIDSSRDRYDRYVRGITIIDGTVCFLYPDRYTFYGQSQSLSFTNTFQITTGITVAGGRIYVSGYYYVRSGNNDLYTACYWVDGARVDLTQSSRMSISAFGTSATGISTTGIAVANDTVYVSGWYRQGESNDDPTTACYWANGTRIDLANGTSASGIAAANGNVYVIGYFRQGSVSIPCYWVNGERRALPGGRAVTGIVVK